MIHTLSSVKETSLCCPSSWPSPISAPSKIHTCRTQALSELLHLCIVFVHQSQRMNIKQAWFILPFAVYCTRCPGGRLQLRAFGHIKAIFRTCSILLLAWFEHLRFSKSLLVKSNWGMLNKPTSLNHVLSLCPPCLCP